MCGIAGIVSGLDCGVRLAAMLGSLAHRGPDDEGMSGSEGVFLGHRRLSVIDLSADGHQPMVNEDGQIRLVYNGEVYGTAPLRAWLVGRGHSFRSRTDSEVIIHLYEEEGAGLLGRLNGMFAFVIHDVRRRRLLLARDRLGIKPLFYAKHGEELVFGSEIGAVLLGLEGAPSLRADVVGQYLLQGYPSTPDTVYEGVYTLPPGHLLDVPLEELSRGLPAPKEYWDAPFTGDDDRPEERILDETAGLLDEAVRGSMVSDVPLGAFLSGGIDSSIIVALMTRHSPRVSAFTVDVPGTTASELEKATVVAGHLRVDHRTLAVDGAIADDYWVQMSRFGQPFDCPSLLSTWLVSREARREVTVALSGDGADECFGGYAKYLRLGRSLGEVPRALARAASWLVPHDVRGGRRLERLASDDCLIALASRLHVPRGVAEELVGVSLKPWLDRQRAIYERYPADPLTRAMYLDLKTFLPDQVLLKADHASMAVSLEVRVPLLDHRVVEAAGRIPARLKVRGGEGKWILRRLLERWVPAEIARQRKQGFDPPLQQWLFDNHLDDCLSILRDPRALFRTLVDGKRVDRWIRGVKYPSPWGIQQRRPLWAIYQLERWLRNEGGDGRCAIAHASDPRVARGPSAT